MNVIQLRILPIVAYQGKPLVLLLRRVNGKVYTIQCQDSSYSVRELWNWIERFIFDDVSSPFYENVLVFVQEYNVLKKYLCFDELRYSVQDVDRPLAEYLDYMGCSLADTINIQILVSANAGNVWRDDGIRYYMNSREEGKHNEPHVHVDIRHEEMVTFSLITGKQLQKEKRLKRRMQR